jgi:hypothetical protein
MSALTLTIYSVFFRKSAMFYNYFNKKHKYKVINYGKKISACFLLLTGWIIGLNYFFEQKIPTDIAKK